MTEVQQAPVRVSGAAHKALSDLMRKWSGWPRASLILSEPDATVSPFAMTTFPTQVFTVNPDPLVLNPNRVINSVTPFRLRQEAVLTGVMLHEAGHARHSHWLPRTKQAAEEFEHSDGSRVTKQTMAFARVIEEARIEGQIAREERTIGAAGLAWTMRAAAIHLLPPTEISDDPNQAVLDVVKSWLLRAGRVIATNVAPPQWCMEFSRFLTDDVLAPHFAGLQAKGFSLHGETPYSIAAVIKISLQNAVKVLDDTGPSVIDEARDILRALFPETDDDDMPDAGDSCTGGGSEDQSQGQDAPASGQDSGEADEQESGGGQCQSDTDSPGEGDSEDDGISQTLADMEAQASASEAAKAKEQAGKTEIGGLTGGDDSGNGLVGAWRSPTKEERETAKNAETFLRSLIDPSETNRVWLSDSPSSSVDGAAMAEWKAGGQIGDPLFFRRTSRSVEPAPPVKVAILVDVSSSMSMLQKPSALLSWALSVAAFDLRNFAGRGSQVESCLIHWGDNADLIQGVGEQLPGIREVRCNQGTRAMFEALNLVETQIPDFFSPKDSPEHRLLVQFTDWELFGASMEMAAAKINRALSVGVNMLTVTPPSSVGDLILKTQILGGSVGERSKRLVYDRANPERVWTEATKMLRD